MSHEVFNNRYIGRKPAWHGLGTVFTDEVGAQDAFSRVGAYDVALEALQTVDGVSLEYRAIMRQETPDDPEKVCFGVVGPDYELITPLDVCQVWDDVVNVSIETLGVLRRGTELFITVELPAYDVKGDPVKSYMVVLSPYDGMHAIKVMATPVRVVCMNTLIAASAAATESYRIIHTPGAKDSLAEWMQHLYTRTVQRASALKQFFEMMSGTALTSIRAAQLIADIYPYSNEPENVGQPDYSQRVVVVNAANKANMTARQRVAELFDGAGTGMDHHATLGTAYGLFNAVTEYEDYMRVGRGEERTARSVVWGARADTKARAFSVIAGDK